MKITEQNAQWKEILWSHILRWLVTFGRCSAIYLKGDNFCDLQFAFLHNFWNKSCQQTA